MFGLSKKEKRDKLSRKIAGNLRIFLLPVIERDEVPSNITYSLYVVGCFSKLCYNYHYIAVEGKTDETESTRFTIDTLSMVLQADPKKMDALLFLGLSNKEPTFIEGMEDGGKLIDTMPDPQREPIEKIMRRIEGIANSYSFE